MPVDPKEIQEAKEVAREVLALLGDVEKHLKSARNWGFYDMLGGGFFPVGLNTEKLTKQKHCSAGSAPNCRGSKRSYPMSISA